MRAGTMLQHAGQWLRHGGRGVLDLIYPLRCVVCRLPAERGQMCDPCAAKLEALENHPACDRCALPLNHPGTACAFCHGKGPQLLGNLATLGRFHEPLSTLIYHLKFHGEWNLGHMLARRLVARPRVRQLLDNADLLLPVPLHPWRRYQRGYNQSAILAQHLSRVTHLPVVEALARIRYTEPQTFLHSRQKREKNLERAFGLVHPERLRDRRVILIDDVYTVGATMRAAARCLREAHPRSIDAITLAVAEDRSRRWQTV